MADLLSDIAAYLRSLSLVQGEGIDTFLDFVPADPDNVVALNEYDGTPALATRVVVRRVQVLVRNTSAAEAKAKAWQIFAALDTPEDRVLSLTSERWALVMAKQTPFRLDTDQLGRVSWVFNVSFTTYRD